MKDSSDSGTDVPEATDSAVPSLIVRPDDRPATAIGLWTPRGIGWASVLLGYPGAVVLAALNWQRMDRARKAIVHLAAVVVGTWTLFFVPNLGSVGLPVGIGVGYYLFRAQKSDQASFTAAGRVVERSGFLGAVVALVATILIVGSGVFIAVATGGGGPAQRGVVLFGTRAGPDVCSLAGEATTFGPSDPIFVAAVLRETVQTGSRVVFEIAGPGGTVGPLPVTAPPPFDCLGSTGSIGPLDPGTYTVRYRYEGQPGSPVLATGTFTVLARPAGSATSPS